MALKYKEIQQNNKKKTTYMSLNIEQERDCSIEEKIEMYEMILQAEEDVLSNKKPSEYIQKQTFMGTEKTIDFLKGKLRLLRKLKKRKDKKK
tara:strand:+ start:7788 stop:8063 length:276 start_codon:yes stop_codon:yes gene_type:complete